MSAVVAFGAMACQNDVEENVTPGEGGNGEKVSFVAEIGDVTRVAIGDKDDVYGYPITLEADDVLSLRAYDQGEEKWGDPYIFTTTDGKNFSCEADGVSELIGKQVRIHNGDGNDTYCSLCGIKGINLSTIVDPFEANSTIKLDVANAVLMFESEYDVTFNTTTNGFFGITTDCPNKQTGDNHNSITIPASEGVRYIAVNGGKEADLSYSIDGVECKKIENYLFEGGKLYNLGTLEKIEVVETKTVYLVPDWWTTDEANFYAYYWFDGGNGNVLMTAEADGTYKGEIPLKATGMKFVRLNPDYDSFGWNDETITDRVWNETDDLVLPEGDKNYFYIQHNCWQVKDFVPVAATTKIYFYPDADWAQAGAWFAAKFGEEWKKLEDDAANTGYTVYSCEYTGDAQTVDFYRMDPAKTALSEESMWNKKTGIAMPEGDKNCYYSTGWKETGATAGYWAALPVVKTTTINVTAYNYSSWDASSIYLYAFATPNAAVAWPGVKMTAGSGKTMTATIEVKYFEGDQVTFIVNNNSGAQTANGAYDIASDIEFYFTDELILDEAPSVPNTHLYLKPNSNWVQGGARFAAYFYGNGERWVSMTDDDKDGIYEVEIPTDKSYPNVIFCRMNPGNANNNWDAKWDQTLDLTVPTYGPNVYVVKEGTWNLGGGEWVNFE